MIKIIIKMIMTKTFITKIIIKYDNVGKDLLDKSSTHFYFDSHEQQEQLQHLVSAAGGKMQVIVNLKK